MSTKPGIVWLKTGPLHPLDSGGKLRTYHMLRELNKPFAVTSLSLCPPLDDESVKERAAEYSDRQVWIPWQETRKFSVAFYAELARNFAVSSRPYIIDKYRSA